MSLSEAHLALWREVFALTEQMGQRASQQAWQQVSELECQRRDLLERFFAEPVAEAAAAEVADALTRVMEADRLIMEAGLAGKEALMSDFRNFSRNRRAQQAYSGR